MTAPHTLIQRAAWALLCLFVFSIPWEKSIQAPGVATLSHLFGILAFAAGAVVAIRRGSIRTPNLAMAFAALWVLWSALTYFWSLDRQATLTRAITLAELLAMLWLIWDACHTPLRQTQLMKFYVWGAVAASASTFLRYFQGRQTYYRRYTAPGFDPNDFGLILALSIPIALYLALRARGWQRWCYRAAVLTVISAVLLTASRTALIATFAAFAFALWTWREADLWQRISTALLLALLVSGMLHFAPTPSRNRLATISNEITRGTLHNRTLIWKAGLKVLKRHPAAGVGAAAYPEAVRPQLGIPGVPGHQYVAHNTFLSVLVEGGLVGFGLYALLLGTLALFVWNMRATERALWSVVAAVWLVGVSTLTWEHYKPGWLLMALMMTEWARSYWPAERPE
ncbi:MAG: O-antigen ligase family protein [Bryobacterales bacterium]|nr:O-antigen ligase family protein [Bryobacterales bacterium]